MFSNRFRLACSLTLILCISIVFAIPGHVQNSANSLPKAKNLRVGFVDLNHLLRRYKPYKDAQQKMINFEEKIRNEIKSKEQELQQMRQNLQQGAQMLSPEQRRKRSQEFQRQAQQYQQMMRQSQQRLQQKEAELLQPVLEQLRGEVDTVAKQNNFDVIERYDRRSNSAVFWVSDRVDVTSTIYQHLKQQGDALDEPADVQNPENLGELEDVNQGVNE